MNSQPPAEPTLRPGQRVRLTIEGTLESKSLGSLAVLLYRVGGADGSTSASYLALANESTGGRPVSWIAENGHTIEVLAEPRPDEPTGLVAVVSAPHIADCGGDFVRTAPGDYAECWRCWGCGLLWSWRRIPDHPAREGHPVTATPHSQENPHWLTAEYERARERIATVPAHARPALVRPAATPHTSAVTPYARARDLLEQVKVAAGLEADAALWWAADGLLGLLRNNAALGITVEAVAARMVEALAEAPERIAEEYRTC